MSRTAPVPVTAIGASRMTEATPAEALRIVPPVQVMTPVATLFDLRPNCWVRLTRPPDRLNWLTVELTVVEPRLSRTIQGVVNVPPLWLRIPTPSMPT